jgi:serine/threonine protein kinase
MPPEFSMHGEVSEKFDVYSLGIIILQIIAGHDDYSTFRKTGDATQLIDLVREVFIYVRNDFHFEVKVHILLPVYMLYSQPSVLSLYIL